MPSRIDIGPEGGPFVELDEENGDLVIRVPNDQIDFANSDIVNVGDIAGIADDPHDNTQHSETFLANGENFDGQGTSSLTNLAAVETEELQNEPKGALVGLSGNQSIAGSTRTGIAWDDAKRDPDGLLDATNNVIIVPADYSFAKIGFNMRFAADTTLTEARPLINGSPAFDGNANRIGHDDTATFFDGPITRWVSVSQNDEIGCDIQIGTGTDLRADPRTNMGVWLR